eukprot:6477133-Amphidinium_carterae.1
MKLERPQRRNPNYYTARQAFVSDMVMRSAKVNLRKDGDYTMQFIIATHGKHWHRLDADKKTQIHRVG